MAQEGEKASAFPSQGRKPETLKKRQSLTRHIVLVLGLFICGLNVIQIGLLQRDTRAGVREDNETGALEMSTAYAKAVGNEIHEYIEHLQMYITEDVSFTGNESEIVNWLQNHERVRNIDFVHVLYCGRDGIGHTDAGEEIDMKDSDCYKAVFEKGVTSFVGEPFFSNDVEQKPVFYVAKPLSYNGAVIGFFAGLANLYDFQEQVGTLKLWDTGYAWILSGKGIVIAHPVKEYQLKKSFIEGLSKGHEDMAAVATRMTKGESGYEWLNGLHGGKDLIAFAPIPETSWSFAFSVTDTEVYRLAVQLNSGLAAMGAVMILVLLVASGFLVRGAIKPLIGLQKSISQIATGSADLTKRIEVKSNNEIGAIVDSFNEFTGKLQSIMSELKQSKDALIAAGKSLHGSSDDTAASIAQILANIQSMGDHITDQSAGVEETAGAVNEIASNIASLERMIETQASGVSQASAAVEEMIGNIGSVDSSIEKLANSFEALQKRAQDGSDKQNDVNERIRQISEQSAMLEEANAAIANIASQTNLLAMNAAIEAAHAGEAGKGFSVVADEIRKLSETSTIQSKTIGEELTKIEDTIGSIVSASMESSEAFSAVAAGIKDTDELVRQIKGAMLEQNEGSKQISEALSSMNNSTSEVRTASSEMSAGNKAILDEVKNLQDATLSMKDSMEQMSVGARKISETGKTLQTIAVQMKDTIGSIGEQVDKFKV